MIRHRGSSLQSDLCCKSRTASAWVLGHISVEPSAFLNPLGGDPSTSNASEGNGSRAVDETKGGGVSIPVGAYTASGMQGKAMVVAGEWRWEKSVQMCVKRKKPERHGELR